MKERRQVYMRPPWEGMGGGGGLPDTHWQVTIPDPLPAHCQMPPSKLPNLKTQSDPYGEGNGENHLSQVE